MLKCELCDERLYPDDAQFHDCSPIWEVVIHKSENERLTLFVHAQTAEKAATNAVRRADERDLGNGYRELARSGAKIDVIVNASGHQSGGRYAVRGDLRLYCWATWTDG